MFYAFKGFIPVVHPSAFVHPSATIRGNVIIGRDVYIGPGAVLRGDWGGIVIHDGANVQENVIVHMFPGVEVHLDEGAHIGHGAIIHGAHIGENVLVGMNAVVMDEASVGAGSIIGALTLVKARQIIPERSLVVGNPGKIIRKVDDKMLAWKTRGTELYQGLPEDLRQHWTSCTPLTEMPLERPEQKKLFETWEAVKNKNK